MEDKTHRVPSVVFVGSFSTVIKVKVAFNCQTLLHTRVKAGVNSLHLLNNDTLANM